MLKGFPTISITFLQVLPKKLSSQQKTHLSYLGPNNNNTIVVSPNLPEDIKDLITSMKKSKASGPNSIPTKILKLFKKEF